MIGGTFYGVCALLACAIGAGLILGAIAIEEWKAHRLHRHRRRRHKQRLRMIERRTRR